MLEIKINKKWLVFLTIIYIYIPVCIFLFGYIKLIYAIPVVFVIGVCAHRFFANFDKLYKTNVKIDFFIVLFVIITITMILYFVGYGGFKEQAMDWYKHNGILTDLIKKDWPVYYINGGEHSMLAYYIGGYMIPAIIGKICSKSYDIAVVATWIYVEIGIVLSYVCLLSYLKIEKWYLHIISLFIFLFMFGMQDIGKMIIKMIDSGLYEQSFNYFFFSAKLQYSSNFSLIRWVPLQGIITWLVMLLFLEVKDDMRYYVFIALPLLLYGVLPFIGVIIYMFVYVIYKIIISKEKKNICKNIFSIENILLLVAFGGILFLYYYGNVFSVKPDEMNFRFVGFDIKIFIFIIFMVMPYVILLYKYYKNNVFYWISIVTLLVLPFTWMGVFNDFMMRVSIPALFVLMILALKIIDNFIESFVMQKKIKDIIPILLILCILSGSFTPICELIDSANTKEKKVKYDTMQIFANRNGDFAKIDRNTLVYNYYAYDIDDNLFYKYIARTKDKKYNTVKSGKIDTRKRK